MTITAREITELISGNLTGDAGLMISGVASVDEAVPGDVVLADDDKYLKKALDSSASCIVTGLGVKTKPADKAIIEVANPAEAFVSILELFKGEESLPSVGIGSGAIIEPGASLGKNVAVGANCFIGRGTKIGNDCILFPNVFIGENVCIGDNCKLYPGVTIYAGCSVGKRAILHAGVVVGSDGFGYKPTKTGLMKLPHAGTVEIGDDVEIGANSAIDRAKTGATVIGNGTKIDNLVHVAHNVKIGSHCVIVALSGIAGSAEIGSGVTLAAQSGIKDHVRIEDGATVAARAGVIGNIAKGTVVSGFPARDHRTELRAQAARMHLPEMMVRLKALENEVAELRSNKGSGKDESV